MHGDGSCPVEHHHFVVDRGDDRGKCEGSIHPADLAGNEGSHDDTTANDERKHIVFALSALSGILPDIYARNRGLKRTEVCETLWQSTLIKALHVLLIQQAPSILVLLIIHSDSFTQENRRTLTDGYTWAGRVLPRKGRSVKRATPWTEAAVPQLASPSTKADSHDPNFLSPNDASRGHSSTNGTSPGRGSSNRAGRNRASSNRSSSSRPR
jgi:hypothetical protein